MTGIVYPTHADKNILIDFGIVEEGGRAERNPIIPDAGDIPGEEN